MTRNKGDFRQEKLDYDSVVITLNGTVSGAVDLEGVTLLGIKTPAALTGTAMTFQISHDGTTYTALYNTSGSIVGITVAASRYIGSLREDFEGFRYLKLVSGTTEVAERTFILSLGRQ